eukprot:1176981-Pyramimonas_sp.AAC.1
MLMRCVEVPGRRSGTIQDCQDATVRLIRGVGIPRILFLHASGSSSNGAYEDGGTLREGSFQQR